MLLRRGSRDREEPEVSTFFSYQSQDEDPVGRIRRRGIVQWERNRPFSPESLLVRYLSWLLLVALEELPLPFQFSRGLAVLGLLTYQFPGQCPRPGWCRWVE
jgi:hypothetical protein